MRTIDVKETYLDNGIHIATHTQPSYTQAISIKVRAGALHERDEHPAGTAHLLEHILIGDRTKKHNKNEVMERYARTGNDYNAFTSLDNMTFVAEVIPSEFSTYLSLTSSQIMEPVLSRHVFNQQKRIILQEIVQNDLNLSDMHLKEYRKKLFGDVEINYDIKGTLDSLPDITLEDLRIFHEMFFVPDNIQILSAGPLKHKEAVRLVENYFGKYESGGQTEKPAFTVIRMLKDNSLFTRPAPEYLFEDNPSLSHAEIRFGVIVPPSDHKYGMAMYALSTILGEQSHSRIFRSLRDKNGLAYAFDGNYDGTYGAGLLELSGYVPSNQKERVLDLIFKQLKNMSETPVTKKELKSVKAALKLGMSKAFNSPNGMIQALEVIVNNKKTPEEVMSNLDKVSPEIVQELSEILLPKKLEDPNYVCLIRDPFISL